VTRLLLRFLRPYAATTAVVVALVLLQAVANLSLPDLNADIINNGVARGDLQRILASGGVMLLVTIVLTGLSLVSVYLGSRTAMAFGRDVRSALFRHVGRLAQTEVNQFGTPSLITRNTNDVQQVQQVVAMALTMMISAPLMLIGGIVMAMRQDIHLSVLLAVILPVMVGFIAACLSRAMPLFRAMQVKVDRINQVMRETLAGVRVIRAFVRDDFEARRFQAANADLTATSVKVNHVFALMIPGLFGIVNLGTVAVVWFGGRHVAEGTMPIGNLTAFLTYLVQILMSVMMATLMLSMLPRAAASAERILAVLDTAPSVRDPASLPAPTLGERRELKGLPASGRIEFRNAEFRYPGARDPVLRGITFTASPGETTAIVGSTGSGKSTLVTLVPRLYDVTAGAVLVDGADVRELALEDVWSRVGFVPQRAFLFRGTIASNLRFGKPDATDDELWRALETAQASEFVREMTGQLEAAVTQGGSNLSGGQRQRVAIARALVKRPGILILDDSFSALDATTDARLRAALRKATADTTLLIVAQRVSTILRADRIVVLDEGAIVGIGTHAELVKTNVTYREIVTSQLGMEGVA
jgi:ATP-binding cassette, subfamily B, multidrug efflux pump